MCSPKTAGDAIYDLVKDFLAIVAKIWLMALILALTWNYLAPIYWPGFKFQHIPILDGMALVTFVRYSRALFFKVWK